VHQHTVYYVNTNFYFGCDLIVINHLTEDNNQSINHNKSLTD